LIIHFPLYFLPFFILSFFLPFLFPLRLSFSSSLSKRTSLSFCLYLSLLSWVQAPVRGCGVVSDVVARRGRVHHGSKAAPGDAMGDCSGVMRQAGTGAGTGRCLAHAGARGGDSGTWHSALIDDGRGIGRGGRPQANTRRWRWRCEVGARYSVRQKSIWARTTVAFASVTYRLPHAEHCGDFFFSGPPNVASLPSSLSCLSNLCATEMERKRSGRPMLRRDGTETCPMMNYGVPSGTAML
jgi:hypothetical protein